jgi:hypothetical protein
VVDLKRVASEIGQAPTRAQYEELGKFTRHQVERAFGLWGEAIKAVFGGKDNLAKARKFKYKESKLENWTIHELDLERIFKDAGNPETIKLIAQPDTHAAHVDERAFACFLSFLEYYKPNVLVNLGDFVDGEGITHWPANDFKPKRLMPEIGKARELLSAIQAHTPHTSTRIFLNGNHEDWLRQALVAKLPELYDGIEEYGLLPTVEGLLDLAGFGYESVPLNHFLKVGKAYFTHGLYTGSSHAKKHLDAIKRNVYYGHLHDTQSYNTVSIDGPLEAASLGCLCTLDAAFLKGRPNNWVHAFGVFEFFPDGSYTFLCPKIINGQMSFNGKVFKG